MNSEPAEVPSNRAEDIYIGFAGIATAGAHLAQTQGTAEQFPQFFTQGGSQTKFLQARLSQNQIFPSAAGHAEVVGLGDGVSGAGFNTRGAEDAFSQIEGHWFLRFAGDGMRRADRHAGGATIGTFCRIHAERATVAVGQLRPRAVGKRHGAAAVPQAMYYGVDGEHGQRSKPQ